jgi:hypothetical protein
VNNFVEKMGLDSRKTRPHAAFNNLPVRRAAPNSLKINDLRDHVQNHEELRQR